MLYAGHGLQDISNLRGLKSPKKSCSTHSKGDRSVPLVGPEEVTYKLLGSRFNSGGNKLRKSEVSQPRWFLWERSLTWLEEDGSELAGHCFTCGGGARHDCIVSTGPADPLLISGKMVEGVRISYFEGAVEAGMKFGRMK
jgi:hypothetical protein